MTNQKEDVLVADPEKPMNPCLWRLMLIVGRCELTIKVDGRIPFSSASMVLVTELMKLSISVVFLMMELKTTETTFTMPTFRFALPFAIPAILYCINNNVGVHMQLHMDPATYQVVMSDDSNFSPNIIMRILWMIFILKVLSNMKILSTALLYRLIIKRPILPIQWVSLMMLVTAGVSNSYGGFRAKPMENAAGTIHITVTGLCLITVYCFVSGLSGVYTEYILKRHYQASLHLQNSLLYIFGIVLNGVGWLVEVSYKGDPKAYNPFHGYTYYTWILIVSQACIGLIMSAVMKHASNITRLFLISSAMLVTTTLSVLIFHLQLNVFFCLAFILVIVALILYHRH